jgi:hypothetical protein
MDDKLISELDYVGSSGYTLNDLLVLVNYDVPGGTTKNTKITDLKNYVLTAVSADTNTFITGFTYNENTFTLYDNSGSTFNADINTMTGLTVNGILTATTISGGTFYGDGSNLSGISTTDWYITGFTYNDNTFTLYDNSGNTFNADINTMTGLTVNGILTATTINVTTISATTYQNLPLDVYVTGFTYNNNTFSIKDNSGSTFNATINTVTGLTVNGDLTVTGSTNFNSINVNTISATTYQNLPTDIRVTGGTFNNNTDTITFTNNTGGTFSVTGITDYYVTGGTFNTNTDTITLNRNDGNTVAITGITDYYVTGATYSQGSLTLSRQDGSISTSILPDWLTSTTYNTKDLVIAYYESEYRLFRALTGFTSSGVSFPGTQTIATDLNSYVGQWQEVSPLRGTMTNVSFSGSVGFNGTITPPNLTGDTNNYNPTGLATCNFMRITNGSGSSLNLTGLKAPNPVSNQAIFICNVGVTQIVVLSNSVASTVGNRFLLGGTKTIQADEGIMVIYDPVTLCWRSQAIQI